MAYTIPFLDCCRGDNFGATADRPNPHRGQDVLPGGQDFPAWVNGVVVFAGSQSCLGNVVTIQNDDDGYFIGVSHLANIKVHAGQRVSIGTPLGNIGNTGSCSDGRHAHITVSPSSPHPWTGEVIDPVAYAASGSGNGETNFHWYGLTSAAMLAMQQMLNAIKLYGGEDGGTGPEDGDFGERSVKGMQEYGKRRGYLPADYLVDGIPHNPDKEAPSNYGFFLQGWARDDAGYDGLQDGLPAGYTSEFLVTAANKVKAGAVTPPEPEPSPTPKLPDTPAGFEFMPDIATSQSSFDFAEYAAAGGAWVAIKMGGGNASDSPYIAPAYLDQLNRARANHQKVVHYWFNGRENGLTPEKSADFFYANMPLIEGDIIALDIEDETATNTKAYTPAEAVAFAKRMAVHYPGIKGLAYMSDSLADSGEWDELVALGWQLWSASWGDNDGNPNTPPTTDDWPFYLVWQYTSEEIVPGNYKVVNGKKEYQRTDGNLARADLFELLGYKKQVLPPDPEPSDDTRELLHNYLMESAALASEYAALLNE